MIEPSDKAILTALYVSTLEPEISPLEFLKNRTTLSEDMYNLRIKDCDLKIHPYFREWMA